jgi:hypothetical protein
VAHLVEQLQRHHLAPDASLLSSSAHSNLLQVRRTRRPPRTVAPPTSPHYRTREIEARLEARCDTWTDLFAMDERGKLLNLNDT